MFPQQWQSQRVCNCMLLCVRSPLLSLLLWAAQRSAEAVVLLFYFRLHFGLRALMSVWLSIKFVAAVILCSSFSFASFIIIS